MTTGRDHTWGVAGWYWISSATSSRKTTDPGDAPMVSPTTKGRESTVVGMPPLCSTSPARLRAPARRLFPRVAFALRRAAGLPVSRLVGARASATWPTTNRARPSLLGSSPRRPTVSSATAVAAR